ncbi:unnamed protein product [Sphenostylis stenocarpa]|uniref:Uncharacterized protein n=1 Tax=Sphenostylis stenocarpa TaxID=92480 RepID=A0AA86TR85_9FABA|nr:unnamed protein product [Sphenostylis stenocarpa]
MKRITRKRHVNELIIVHHHLHAMQMHKVRVFRDFSCGLPSGIFGNYCTIMPPALSDPLSATAASSGAVLQRSAPEKLRFEGLRGLRWRINLGVLPCSTSTSIDDLRRVTANCRRRYAGLRRRLLVEPHVPKDGTNSPNLVIDNPLSLNPGKSEFFSLYLSAFLGVKSLT